MSDPTTLPSGGGGMNWDEILREQETDPGFAPVPDGKYPVRVEAAEAVIASTGADMLKVQFAIEGGPFDTKKVFTNIVFSKGNPTAMRFTLAKLAALGVSRETLAAQNPTTAQIATMILGQQAEAEVTVRPATEEYPAQNDVKKLRKLGTAVPSAPTPTPAPAPAAGVPPTPTVPPAPSIPTPPPAPAPEAAAPPIPTPPPEPTPEPAAEAPAPEATADVPPAPGEPEGYDPAEEPF